MATREQIIDALKTVQDPEILLDIWFLGLIYNIDINDTAVKVEMTFTSPMCPVGPQIVSEVKEKILSLSGVDKVDVEVVFVPPWEPSEEVKAMLGMM